MGERMAADVDDAAGLTRRQFLVGGGVALGALAVAGVVAQRTLPLRTYWYRLTGQCGPETPVPEDLAEPTYGVFQSTVLGTDVEYGRWEPDVMSYRPGSKPPVCYCLPARGQDPHWVLDAPVCLADYAAVKTSGGGVPVLALVAVDGSDTYWHERADGEDRMAMLLDEFIPWYEQRHDVGGARERRAVMGWSMGGYGALLAAERRPDMFAAVCAASPALWRSYDDGVGDAFDDAQDFAENDVFASIAKLRDTAVRVDCGKADVFHDAARDFAARCEEQTGRPVAGDVRDAVKGCHDPDYWRRVAPDELDFVRRALAGAGAEAWSVRVTA
ncbi:MAG TPA: alpha/beta hydrolase-fold protein [Thermoleophilia bacterium]|nr:alpha/beta hydrolase-fold protein [Thermoleophilia bacterium]